jgi:hypothetical protein
VPASWAQAATSDAAATSAAIRPRVAVLLSICAAALFRSPWLTAKA